MRWAQRKETHMRYEEAMENIEKATNRKCIGTSTRRLAPNRRETEEDETSSVEVIVIETGRQRGRRIASKG